MKNSLLSYCFFAGLVLSALSACETTKPPGDPDSPVAGAPVLAEPVSPVAASTSTSPTLVVPKAADPAPAAIEPPARPKPEQSFAEGREAYEKGDYRSAIRKLSMASEGATANSALQRDSLKLLAFSYCVSGQKVSCRAKFANLLKLAPSFQLSRAEAGHPLWGPVFKEAQAAVPVAAKRN